MDIFAKLAEKIIEEQETIIGPIALEQARKVTGLTINWQKREVSLEGNKTQILAKLVDQYKTLFGHASVEVCKEAVNQYRTQISSDLLPQVLR
ncbi:hypothetical protein A2954_05865 [Candidatus Roizmanbacteria bacterium RIFCSPLOWO2_01_FULL_37_12]|uniref:Uncharacterized protein n=1 Tax=Candidatus Roizmanbacteria bacterium RIFCSPLOWO2_01_FULL_37_12 TaxID=1802056 RepID=A0A1F7IBW1_9BACT|nr:MAG: hypothetical protein A2768_02605 [Candidatus Roizmanbacteria bacterium RIFCSPHIGHO2_01_FULL_37_16]OGK25995.1 MAG: hypothetical protein A3D76_03480 [Candidatus Roizmanbacteria bacterium RIFCSPHIGHO2_02_FULL_37_9b]OGK40832.1 MAG: hypothetical protein A2954_05865 [Candidatus Roizmanbacteria bacterium RIFCSPLOWO2_01_FULL_37_12]